MGNYGKPFIVIGIIITIIGGIIMGTMSRPEEGFDYRAIPLAIGLALVLCSLPRLVQGANPKVMGKIVRPKAAARSAWMWSMIVFNITPVLLSGSKILTYGPPFLNYILFSGYFQSPHSGYDWVPFVFIGFMIFWVLSLFFTSRHPNFVRIVFDAILACLFMLWVDFGIQITLWTLFSNRRTVPLFSFLGSTTDPMQFGPYLGLASAYTILGTYLAVRMLSQMVQAFSALDVKKASQKTTIFSLSLILYIAVVLPLYLGIVICMENHGYVYPFVQYIGYIYMAVIGFKVITSLLNVGREFSKQKIGEGKYTSTQTYGFSTAVFLFVFFIAWSPIFLPLVDGGLNNKFHSAYNPNWSGTSNFRSELEKKGYQTMSLLSSFNSMTRLDPNKQLILIIAGPNVFYNPASEIPFFMNALKSNMSMMICDDHGTVETLLFELFVASSFQSPLAFIPKGVLKENATDSYWKTPAFPLIKNWNTYNIPGVDQEHPITSGKNYSVALSYSSAFLFGMLLRLLGWSIIGTTSGTLDKVSGTAASFYSYSYVDVDDNGVYDPAIDNYPLPEVVKTALDSANYTKEIEKLTDFYSNNSFKLAGYPQAVFISKDIALNTPLGETGSTYSSRIFAASDASWLNNELTSVKVPGTNEYMFDNLEFALNTVDYLACGRNASDCIVVFDEAHIKPESGYTELTSAATFGAFQGYVNWLSTNPILSLVYPLFALYSLRKWIPSEENKKKLQLKELLESERNLVRLKFRTSSFFARKINWYRVHKRYKQALTLLYRRVERKLRRILGDNPATVDNIVNGIIAEKGRYIAKDILLRIRKFFTKMLDLKANKLSIATEEQFQDMFMEMNWIADNI